jgi:hypothetical protein
MYDEVFELKQFIEKLNKQRQIDVLKILVDNNINVSENKNGSFINLSLVPENIIIKLKEYIQYIKDQDVSLEKLEDVKKDFKSSFFSNNKTIETILNLNKEKSISKNNVEPEQPN